MGVRPRWLPYLAHLIPALWLFEGLVFRGQLPFFRDIGLYYYPNYVFLDRSLRQGVWPLWNPTSDAGAPFLMVYPIDLLSVLLLGAERALALGLPLHVFIAMTGATWLARTTGAGAWGAWFAGAAYGCSGYLLSTLNLFELSHAAAWGPWVAGAGLRLVEAPTARRTAALSLLAAIQISTLSAETVLQALLTGPALVRRRLDLRAGLWLAGALALAALTASPALLGTLSLVEGTHRAGGFQAAQSFAWSVHPAVLADAVLPRFFGDTHVFSSVGYWGQAFFPDGYPYLLSLYLGLPVLLFASRAGRGHGRLWALAGVGLLLSLGAHGPLLPILAPLMRSFRAPVKFFFLVALPLALLAGHGLDRARREPGRGRLGMALPGTLLLAGAGALALWTDATGRMLGSLAPALAAWQAQGVICGIWPNAFAVTGALALGAGLALWAGRAVAPVGALLACFDLLIVNGPLNPATDASFYALAPGMRSLLSSAREGDGSRWFSYGVAATDGIRWDAAPPSSNRDDWLYYVERQSLLPRAHVLDGLYGAFDEDRVGWAPVGATLAPQERVPRSYPWHHFRLRLAAVRWVLSFAALPPELTLERGQAAVPGLLTPLGLYELREPLPRALWVPKGLAPTPSELSRSVLQGGFDPRAVVLLDRLPAVPEPPPVAAVPPAVSYEEVDPHTVRLTVSTPPGFIVVANGYHRDWYAEDVQGPVPLLRANGRYWALPTPGGHRTFLVRFRPSWRGPALAAGLLGGVMALALGLVAVLDTSGNGALTLPRLSNRQS